MVSSAPQPTPQMTSAIGTVGPAPSTIVHHTGLTAATTISMEPSTSTPTPTTSASQGITHFMSRAGKLLQMERSATMSIADAINTLHGPQKMHAVTYESMYEELLDTHQRVYDRDVEKAAFFDRNRILNRQVNDLKEVISSLNLQLREAQVKLQQKSVVRTMVCERCAQMELTVTTPIPVATISLPTQGIPTTYSGGISLVSQTLPGSQEQTEVVTSMPLPSHRVFTCPLPGRPFAGASTYAPSMPATPFVSSSAPIQPDPALYSSHFGTLPQYHVQLPTPHHWPSPSQTLVSSSVSLQPNPALYSSHFDESDIKLADFGLALEFSPGLMQRERSRMARSAYYMTPKVLHGEYLEEGIFNAIQEGQLDLTFEPWQTISPSANDMIAQMLCLDEKLTCTTAQALDESDIKVADFGLALEFSPGLMQGKSSLAWLEVLTTWPQKCCMVNIWKRKQIKCLRSCVRSVVSSSELIAGYAQQQQDQEALGCFQHMLSEGISPDAITDDCILKACGTLKDTETSKRNFDDLMSQGLSKRHIMLGIALVDMYA
ncbi:hypothetical protein L7F22_034899 [Adiantum nelumboides]|nr:hypothetical protein [Adiantum nelumboides]